MYSSNCSICYHIMRAEHGSLYCINSPCLIYQIYYPQEDNVAYFELRCTKYRINKKIVTNSKNIISPYDLESMYYVIHTSSIENSIDKINNIAYLG